VAELLRLTQEGLVVVLADKKGEGEVVEEVSEELEEGGET
jgi:hypothetical protein